MSVPVYEQRMFYLVAEFLKLFECEGCLVVEKILNGDLRTF